MLKLSGIFLIVTSMAGVVGFLKCDSHKPTARAEEQGKRSSPAPTSTPAGKETPGAMDGEIKELAASTHCRVFESFVFVARDVQTYQSLQTLNTTLPEQSAEFFKTHAVIAAFLGQRRTGGFGVNITQGPDGVIQVTERIPKGMVTMVLTTPYKIVAVPVTGDGPIKLSLDATWKERWRTYRLASGELTISGGFAGTQETSGLTGTLQSMREHTLATLIFELKSTGKRQTRLSDMASGTVNEAGQLSLTYLASQSLTGAIQSPFKATGQFTSDELELSLNLETVPAPNISDNFSGRVSLRATATSPRPPNRAVTGEQ